MKGNLNMKADISFRQNISVIRTMDIIDNEIVAANQITGWARCVFSKTLCGLQPE